MIKKDMKLVCRLIKSNHPKEAIDLYEIIKSDKQTSNDLFLLGLAHYMIGDYNMCTQFLKMSLKECFDANVAQWFKLLDLNQAMRLIITDSINYHFENEIEMSKIEIFIRKTNKAFYETLEFFKTKLRKKIDIYVFAGQNDMNGNCLSYANPPMTSIYVNVNYTGRHELIHVLFNNMYDVIEKTKFIDEGIAVWFDREDDKNMDDMIENNIDISINVQIKKMWENFDDNNIGVYSYKVAGLFVGYMIESVGKENFFEFSTIQTLENANRLFGKDFMNKLIMDFEYKIKNRRN